MPAKWARLSLAILLVQCVSRFTDGLELGSDDPDSAQAVPDEKREIPDGGDWDSRARSAREEAGDQSLSESEAVSVRDLSRNRYNYYPTVQNYLQKIAEKERELQACCNEMGWPMPNINVQTNWWPWWGEYDDRRKRQLGSSYVQNLADKLSLLDRELTKCQTAKAARTTPAPTADYLRQISTLEPEVEELLRLLIECLKLGGYSYIKINVDKRRQVYLKQRLAKLETLRTLYRAEVANCFKGIGRLPNGELIPTSAPTTTLRPTTTPWPTTTLLLTTTSGIFTTTIPLTTLC